MSKFDHLSAEQFAELEAIVGTVDREAGMTDTQYDKLVADEVIKTLRDVESSPMGDTTMLGQLIRDKHYLFNGDAAEEGSIAKQFMQQYSMLATQAYKVFLHGDSIDEFLKFSQGNPIKSFAGPGHDKLRFPTANTWFELILPEGRRPMVPPVGENIKTDSMRLRINRVAIHATCDMSIQAFPIESDSPQVAEIMARPTFRREANVMAFVDVEGHGLHTYGGMIQYGYGGAKLFKVYDAEQACAGFQGEPPTMLGHARMTNFAQFVCGLLCQTLGFFDHKGTMKFEALRAHHRFEGQTGFSDDVSFFSQQDEQGAA